MKKLLFVCIVIFFAACDYNGIDYNDLYQKRALINYYQNTHPYYCDGDVIMKLAVDHYVPVQDCSDRGQICILYEPDYIGCVDPE